MLEEATPEMYISIFVNTLYSNSEVPGAIIRIENVTRQKKFEDTIIQME